MTWIGGIVLGLGVLLVAALAWYRTRQFVRRRAGLRAADSSYAGRLDAEAEHRLPDEIDRAADALIREHGASAVIAAAKQMLPTLSEEDRRGRAVWRQVLESAEAIRRRDEQQDEAAE